MLPNLKDQDFFNINSKGISRLQPARNEPQPRGFWHLTLCTLLSSQGSDAPDIRPKLGCRSGATCLTYPPRQSLSNRLFPAIPGTPKHTTNTTKNTTQPVTHTRWEAYYHSPTQTLLKQKPYAEMATIWSHVRPKSTAAFRTFGVRIDTLRSPHPPVKTPPTRACRDGVGGD